VITVQDRIDVAPEQLPRLRAMLRERYLPGALARGLRLEEELVSPPLVLADQCNTLWLRWSLPDAGAFWAMRFRSGDPAVAAFWREVDAFVIARERCFLVSADAQLPGPQDVSAFLASPTQWRETAQLYLREGRPAEDINAFEIELADACATLPGLATMRIGQNMVPEYGAGHFTLDLVYPDPATAEAARAGAAWREQVLPLLSAQCRAVSALGLGTVGAGARAPDLANGIKRTALFRLLPEVSPEAQDRFERDTLEMAAQIPAILNWRLSRAIALDWDASGCAPWSYVWEQEYATLDGLTVDYMVHPHHWAHVDRSFDPESGVQIIDTALCHAFCPLEASVITH
jgi:hypothetical protein